MNLMNQINYLKEYLNQDMFDDCSVPAGLDMQRIRGAIVMRCGLLTPLFSEPETQRNATQQFFFENQWNFQHVINIMNAEYSPIENVAEWRNESTKNSGTDTLTINKTGQERHSGTDSRVIDEDGTNNIQESGSTATQANGNTTTTREISAENASTYQPDNQEIVNHGEGETVTHGKHTEGSDSRDSTDDFTHGHVVDTSGKDTHVNDKDSKTDYEVYRHGNVGVTTNQQMINEELDLLNRFNPYRFIADLYEKELILGIY